MCEVGTQGQALGSSDLSKAVTCLLRDPDIGIRHTDTPSSHHQGTGTHPYPQCLAYEGRSSRV
ncbi:hypothetical protein GCM10009548_73860 [Streptomyces malaysiensis subsp. malaysiensis]